MTSRRNFLASVSAGAIGMPALLTNAHADTTVKIGSVLALSGPFASPGKVADLGARLAAKAVGKELGLGIDYLSIDGEGNPGQALPKVISAMQQGDVRLFAGGVLSSVGLALSSQIATAGGVYMSSVGADEITGSQCRKSTFRWPVPSYGAIRETVLPLIGMLPSAKRWYTITPKYVFGEALLERAQEVFKEKGIEHVGNSYHSLAETEFSSLLANVTQAKPDVLLLLNFGEQATSTLRQAAEFGLKEKMKILLAWDAGLEQYQAIGSDVFEGVYTGTQYYHDIDSPGNKHLVELFKTNLKRLPSYAMVNGYTCTELLIRAVKAAGSPEPAAVIKALEGMTYAGPTGTETIQAFDHQCVKNYYLGLGKPKSKKRYDDDFIDILSFGKSFLPASKTECKMA